jgi:hypothetical protein
MGTEVLDMMAVLMLLVFGTGLVDVEWMVDRSELFWMGGGMARRFSQLLAMISILLSLSVISWIFTLEES